MHPGHRISRTHPLQPRRSPTNRGVPIAEHSPSTGTFRIRYQTGSRALFASVEVRLEPGPRRVTVEVSRNNVLPIWTSAAVEGSYAGLRALGPRWSAAVTDVVGLFTDTSCTAVAAAAFMATMRAASRSVPSTKDVALWCWEQNLDFSQTPTRAVLSELEGLPATP